VIFGTVYDENLGDRLRVTVIATGLSPARRQQAPITVVHSAPVQRTGTDNLPILHNGMSPAGNPALTAPGLGMQGSPVTPDYAHLGTPSVWRNRTAAAKVDALSSNGMDEIEIPAFLRKQAD
jgi:cell division protein FtsZ